MLRFTRTATTNRTSAKPAISGFLPLIFAVLSFVLVLSPATSRADEVDIAVDAFALAGPAIGINFGEPEKVLAKSLLRCTIKGRKSALDCAREELVRTLPPEAQPFGNCLLQGGRSDQCLRQALQQAVIQQLPPEAQGLATCIAQETNVMKCSERFALNAAQQRAFSAIDAFKVEAERGLGSPTPGPLADMIGMAEGIRDNDWGKIVRYGGTAAAKVAGRIILAIFLPPELAELWRPPPTPSSTTGSISPLDFLPQ